MKLSLTNDQLNKAMKAIDGLSPQLQYKPLRWEISADSVSAYSADAEIGTVSTGGISPGAGWVQSKLHGSESIHIQLSSD
jgi:hypothetical protein